MFKSMTREIPVFAAIMRTLLTGEAQVLETTKAGKDKTYRRAPCSQNYSGPPLNIGFKQEAVVDMGNL